VAYVVADQDDTSTKSDLRRFLKEKLPEYMVPTAFVILDALPLTPTGKVNRRALPAPDRTRPKLKETFVPPRTHMESLIAKVWQEVLVVEKVGVYDNFFNLGGHSLLSMQVIARLEKQLGLRLNPRELIFQNLGQMAALCEERMPLRQQSDTMRFTRRLWQVLVARRYRKVASILDSVSNALAIRHRR
jgi:acyl carrier protein